MLICFVLETLVPAPLNLAPFNAVLLYLPALEEPDPENTESPLSSGFHVDPAAAINATELSTILQKITGLFVNRLSDSEMEGRYTMRIIVAIAALWYWVQLLGG
jgi:hypothetical protein